MLYDTAVAALSSRHPHHPLEGYERYRTKDPAEASALSAAVLSTHQLVVRDHDHQFEATCSAIEAHSTSLLYMTYGTNVVVDRVRPPRQDYLAILLPTRGQLRLRHQGREFDLVAGEHVGITSSRDALHMQWSQQAQVLTLRVDRLVLETALGHLLLEDAPSDFHVNTGPVSSPARWSLMGTAELLAASYEHKDPASPLPAVITRRLEEQVLSAVLLGVEHNYRGRLLGEQPRPGRRVVREVVELIGAESEAHWTIPGLASAVGVTVRALELGFRKELDKTPREFVRDTRLMRAHDELQRANPGDGTTVTDVACRWGFWHAGRFANSYAQRFGERPMATLRATSALR